MARTASRKIAVKGGKGAPDCDRRARGHFRFHRRGPRPAGGSRHQPARNADLSTWRGGGEGADRRRQHPGAGAAVERHRNDDPAGGLRRDRHRLCQHARTLRRVSRRRHLRQAAEPRPSHHGGDLSDQGRLVRARGFADQVHQGHERQDRRLRFHQPGDHQERSGCDARDRRSVGRRRDARSGPQPDSRRRRIHGRPGRCGDVRHRRAQGGGGRRRCRRHSVHPARSDPGRACGAEEGIFLPLISARWSRRRTSPA